MKNNSTSAVKAKEETKTPAPITQDREPYRPFHSLQRDMNRLFDDFTRGLETWRPRLLDTIGGEYYTRINVAEGDSEIVITAELPGVSEKDVQVTVSPDSVTIKGEKKEEKEETDKGYYHMERSFGYFHRVLQLPAEIDKDKAEAVYKNGVLRITLPKTKESMKDVKMVEIKKA